MKKQKTRTKQYIDKNPIESLLSIGGGVVKSAKNDVLKGARSDFWNQFLGAEGERKGNQETNQKGDLLEGQEITLSDVEEEKRNRESTPSLYIEPAIDYRGEILHLDKEIANKENHEISVKIQEILIELKRLTQTSKELQVEFKEVVVEPRITKPGKYHLNFFEWVLSAIRIARMKVEDSKAWLAAMKGKHARKGYYWTMSQENKGGTSFSLSSERVVATQTG